MTTATSALRFLAPAAALVVAGCGAVAEDAGTRAYVERHLDAWTGARSEHIVQRFGAPDDEAVLADGERVLTYRRTQPVLRALSCEVSHVGAAGTITAARCSGPADQCLMLLNPATRYSPSRPSPARIGLR